MRRILSALLTVAFITAGFSSVAFAEDEAGLERMRRSYGVLMANSSDADAFAIVTEKLELRGIKFAQLASKIATTNTLDRFMTAYRDTFLVDDPVIN